MKQGRRALMEKSRRARGEAERQPGRRRRRRGRRGQGRALGGEEARSGEKLTSREEPGGTRSRRRAKECGERARQGATGWGPQGVARVKYRNSDRERGNGWRGAGGGERKGFQDWGFLIKVGSVDPLMKVQARGLLRSSTLMAPGAAALGDGGGVGRQARRGRQSW